MQSQTYPIPKSPARYTDMRGFQRWLPAGLVPYGQLLRLDRPTGYWLLLLPAWFAILLGSPSFGWQTVGLMVLFFLGSIALRGAGCVINDFWDRELDRRVERTADRPLASGAISARRALAFFGMLICLGVVVLLFLPWSVWVWAFLSLPLIVLYPLAKRLIPTPQAVLALTFSWGAILGWLSVHPHLTWTSLLLYLGAFCWILYYDTIYACQDRGDDQRMDLKSMPLFLGKHLEIGLEVFAGLTIGLWGLALVVSGAGVWAWLGLLAVGAAFAWQLRAFDPDQAAACLKQFQQNARFGQVFSVLLLLDLVL